ncbi:MAG: nicotinate-nucleotide adenylyltransferase [Halanaerobium sp.]|nr:nicotinate-nucleotide adenylyltransferase [Halanaerobium sp.]
MAKKKIGLMGGTFDPVHYGHLATAESAADRFGLDKVIFVPTGVPPHKSNEHITSAQDRFNMVLLATINNYRFVVSRYEIDKEGPSYSIETVKHFKQIFNSELLYFITGADAILQLPTWKEPEKLLADIEFIAATRPGYSLKDMQDSLYQQFDSRIHILEIPGIAISSTEIRNRVATGASIKYLLPPEVENYIYQKELYV